MKDDKNLYPTEKCWMTGNFTDDCNCDFCEHKIECSGFNNEEEEDDE